MKSLVLTILSITILNGLVAQTSYQGGKGDGYTMSSFVFQSVDVNVATVDKLEVFPSILSAGSFFSIKHSNGIKDIQLINMNGQVWSIGKEMRIPNSVQSGIYSIRLRQNENIHIIKVAIMH